jgi:PAS domain S-box-containing protein
MTTLPSSIRTDAPSEGAEHRGETQKILGEAVALGVSAVIDARSSDDAMFRMMAETLSEILFMCGPEGFNRYVNRRFCEYTGMTMEECLGFGWVKAMHPDDIETTWDAFQAANVAREPYELECRLRRADGAYRWFLNRVNPMTGEGPNTACWVGTLTDIQDLKDAQSQLEQGRERYTAFIRNSSEGIWRFELERPIPVSLSEDEQIEHFFADGYLAECNDAMARMYGMESAAELAGARLGDLLVREDARNVEFLRAFIRSGYRIEEAESAEKDKDGNPKYFINNFVGSVLDGHLLRGWGVQRDVTRQKLAQQELAAGEERLRIAIDAGRIGAWEWNIPENRITWSERIYEFHGVKPGEYDGTMESFAKLIHPEDLPMVQQAIEKAMKGDEGYQLSFRALHSDGAIHWLETSGRVMRDAEGKPQRMLGAVMDITERKQVQARLIEGEERLRFALTASKLVAWSWNLANNEVSVSENALSVLGVDSKRPLKGEDAESWIHPDHVLAHRQNVAQGARKKDGEYASQLRFIRPDDGRVIWVEDRGRVTVDADGNLIRVGGIIHDITERKITEEAIHILNTELEEKVADRTRSLQATLKRLQHMIGRLPMAALVADENGIILEVNDALCEMFGVGRSPAEMIGRKGEEFAEILLKNIANSEEYEREISSMREAKGPKLNTEIRLKDGRLILRDFIPIADEGTTYGVLILYRDVTQERRVDATKSEFMSLASHQLRTPLTAVRWSLGRLEKSFAERATSFEKRLLEEGRKGAARMTETIDTMLQISRIESGTVQMSAIEIDLAAFMKEAFNPLAADAKLKHQDVRIDCPERLRIKTDANFLKEILSNLFSNAVKYTPPKGVIRIKAESAHGSVRIDVSDTGYGIPEHQQSKIFRKFFRGDNVVTRDTEGTGLGLYLVSLMTQLLQGTISFKSKEGEGTTFTLVLPLEKQ